MTSELKLQSLLQFTNNNEAYRYCEAKQLFDSVYAISKTKGHQWKHMMLCLKVSNNETKNYRTCQKKFDFLKLSRSPINKEPVRKLNKNIDVTNYSVNFLKKYKL